MNAHSLPKGRTSFNIQPAAVEHAEAIQELAGIAYHMSAEQAKKWYSAEQYRSRIARFPEGQFVALANGRVVGMTSSMNFHFNPDGTFLEDWGQTSGYG